MDAYTQWMSCLASFLGDVGWWGFAPWEVGYLVSVVFVELSRIQPSLLFDFKHDSQPQFSDGSQPPAELLLRAQYQDSYVVWLI